MKRLCGVRVDMAAGMITIIMITCPFHLLSGVLFSTFSTAVPFCAGDKFIALAIMLLSFYKIFDSVIAIVVKLFMVVCALLLADV